MESRLFAYTLDYTILRSYLAGKWMWENYFMIVRPIIIILVFPKYKRKVIRIYHDIEKGDHIVASLFQLFR